MQKVTMTKIGYDRLMTEMEGLKRTDRPAVIDAIAEAREHGDLAENAEYHAAREEQAHIEDRIQEVENILANVNMVDPTKMTGDTVMFGATVKIVNEETEEESTYQIVSEHESNLEEQRISNTSPLGSAMIGKEIGDLVQVTAPGGDKEFEILEVNYV